MKRNLLTLGLAAAMALMLTGCAAGSEPAPSASPMTSPLASPNVTAPDPTTMIPESNGSTLSSDDNGLIVEDEAAPDTAPAAASGVSTPADARKAMEQIEEELERLSEVEDAEVVLAGDTAAVALEFDSQYQGGVDDRLRKMVKERVDGVVKGVKTIEITEDLSLLDELSKLGDRLEDAVDLTEIRTELDTLMQRITGQKM